MADINLPLPGETAWGAKLNAAVEAVNADVATRAPDGGVVHTTGDEAIAGVKTFAQAPQVPDASFSIAKVNGLAAALEGAGGGGGGVGVVDADASQLAIDYNGTPFVGARDAGVTTGALASGTRSVAIGGGTTEASGIDGVAIGNGAIASADRAAALGRGAEAGFYSVAIGSNAWANSADSSSNTAIGDGTSTGKGNWNTAVGSGASAGTLFFGDPDVNGASAFGYGAGAHHNYSTAVGYGASTAKTNQVALGSASHEVTIPGRLNVARRTPTGTADTQGVVGDITSDDSYVYVKTSTGWKRAALTTW